jgi:hypothetical protein
MITSLKVKKFLEERIRPYISNDISCAFHEEFYFNPQAEINFVIKLLSGTIQSGVTQYPIQLMVEVKHEYANELLEILTKFANDYNELVDKIDNVSIRQYYSTPAIIDTFGNDGIDMRTTMSMDINFITFENLLDVENVYINDEKIAFLNYNISYAGNVNSTGGLNNAMPGVIKQINKSAGNTISLSFVPNAEIKAINDIVDIMYNCTNANTQFNIKTQMSGKEYNIPCILINGSISKEIRGFPVMQVSFMRGDF